MKPKSLLYILTLLLVTYSGYWVYLSQNAESQVKTLTTSLEKKSIFLTYDGIETSGFPYRLIINFKNPEFILREGFINLSWKGGALDAFFQPWNLTHMIFTGNGGEINFGKEKDKAHSKSIIPESFRASFITAKGAEQRLSIEILNGVYSNGLSPSQNPSLMIESINLHGRLNDSITAEGSNLLEPKIGDLSLTLRDIKKPGFQTLGTPNEFQISMTPRGIRMPTFTKEGLGEWRNQGSTVDINGFSLNWRKGTVTGSGSLTLDEAFRPLGVISGEYKTPTDIIEFLSLAGFITSTEGPRITMGLKTMSSLFKKKQGQKTPFSISAQGGGLWLGSLKFKSIEPVLN